MLKSYHIKERDDRMLFASVTGQCSEEIVVCSLGLERDSEKAHWGPGVRDTYILHYVLEGEGFFNGNPVRKGQGFFIKRGQLHEYHSDTQTPWQYFWLIFKADAEVLERCFAGTALRLDNHIFEAPFLPDVRKLVDSLHLQSFTQMSGAKGLAVFYTLISFHEKNEKAESWKSAADAHIRSAVHFIDNNYHKPIRVTDVAKHIYVDDRYLYNLFQKKLGTSPKSYLNQLRIRRAEGLLQNTQLSVTYIGESVGYNDILAFSAFFKKQTGMSPSQYREKHRLREDE